MRTLLSIILGVILGVLVTIGIFWGIKAVQKQPTLPILPTATPAIPLPQPNTPTIPASTPTPKVAEPPQPTPTPTPKPSMKLEVTLNQEQYRVGDLVVMTIAANQDCYLILYSIDSAGAVERIFPNSFVADSQIKKGLRYQIPPANAEFEFQISGPAGNNRVHALCSTIRIDTLESTYQTPDEFARALQQTFQTLAPDQWTETKIAYQIQAK